MYILTCRSILIVSAIISLTATRGILRNTLTMTLNSNTYERCRSTQSPSLPIPIKYPYINHKSKWFCEGFLHSGVMFAVGTAQRIFKRSTMYVWCLINNVIYMNNRELTLIGPSETLCTEFLYSMVFCISSLHHKWGGTA